MATAARIGRRHQQFLQALHAFVDDLPALSTEWEHLEDGPQATLSLDWDHLMADYLTELDEHYRCGRLAPEQRARYRELLSKLKAALPIIHRLKLYQPPVSLG